MSVKLLDGHNEVSFSTIKVGTFFEFDGEPFLKLNSNEGLSVCLDENSWAEGVKFLDTTGVCELEVVQGLTLKHKT